MSDIEDKDSFWKLDDMLPPIKSKDIKKSDFDIQASDFEISSHDLKEGSGEKLDFSRWLENREKYRAAKNESVTVYTPENPLIKSVTVRKPISRRTSVERFLKNGRLLFNEEGEFSGNVPFQSVYPQYALLSDEQKSCYIGFRSALRKGIFPKADGAYIYLYLYEIINLSDLMSPSERADKIAALICGYPDCDDKLFADMCNWLADICLIHRLSIPKSLYGSVYPRVVKSARLKEFFIKYSENSSNKDLYRLMAASAKYNFSASKYYEEYKQYYDKYIEGAVCHALSVIAKTERRYEPSEDNIMLLTNESFFGAYRTVQASYTITVQCAALTRSEEEKRVVTELTKYAENCLRTLLGIKPRLTVSYLVREKKDLIKGYFAENARDIKSASKPRAVPQVPEYERLYEPKDNGFTVESAELIEQSSWAVTEKLVDAFEPEYEDITEPANVAPTDNEELAIKGICALLAEDAAAFEHVAKSSGMMSMALADDINNFLLDKIGDVGIEVTDEGFRIADWYREDIEAIVSEGDK